MENTRAELYTEEQDKKQIKSRSPEEPENILALPTGTVLDGRYRLVRVIRQGGFGITYEGVHIQSGGRVAVKEYFCREICVRLPETYAVTSADSADLPRFEEDRARFLREARILREFAQEPSVVTVLDYFEENGTAYIVMEYIKGITLNIFRTSEKIQLIFIYCNLMLCTDLIFVIHNTYHLISISKKLFC